MHFISAIPKLTGQNYVLWREELDAALALAEIDLALQEPTAHRNLASLIPDVMDVVGIGRIESRGAAAELQYPRATVPRGVLFMNRREAEGPRLGL
jgi:hypothetical protein